MHLLQKANLNKDLLFVSKFDSKPVYNEKYLKTKIKSYNRKMKTNFHNNEIQKECSNVFAYQ